MARGFNRQAIIDGYLAETGRNMFEPGEFVDWLAGQPDHEAYPWFYGKDDATAAREYRIQMARQMASGLRITVRSEEPGAGGVVRIVERSYPALISPIAGRRTGGGYQPFDPSDPAAQAELRRQGAVALVSWVERYAGAFEAAGLDCAPVKEIAAQMTRRVASAA